MLISYLFFEGISWPFGFISESKIKKIKIFSYKIICIQLLCLVANLVIFSQNSLRWKNNFINCKQPILKFILEWKWWCGWIFEIIGFVVGCGAHAVEDGMQRIWHPCKDWWTFIVDLFFLCPKQGIISTRTISS